MKPRYVMGIDPSGAFKEGKGTTGWCIYDTKEKIVREVGTIKAMEYECDHYYWHEHPTVIESYRKLYDNKKGTDFVISIEDYILYKNKASAQVNSAMETSQLLGIIKHYCWNEGIPYYIRPAVLVKKRWADKILEHKGLIYKKGRRYHVKECPKPIYDHERDAIRHAVHCAYFELKG